MAEWAQEHRIASKDVGPKRVFLSQTRTLAQQEQQQEQQQQQQQEQEQRRRA